MKAHPELTPQRTALANHFQALMDVSFHLVDTLPGLVQHLEKSKRLELSGPTEEVIDRLDLSAGKMETWLRAPQWKDSGELPGINTTVRKTFRLMGQSLEVLDAMENAHVAPLIALFKHLKRDYQRVSRHIDQFLALLDGSVTTPSEELESFRLPAIETYQALMKSARPGSTD